MRYRACLLLLLTAAMCFSAYAQVETSAVLQTLKRYDKAWNGKDAATVGKILAPGYIYFSSTGGTTSRRVTLDFLASPDYKLTFVERSEIEVFGTRRTAIVSSRWKGKGVYAKGEINDDQRCSLVFVKERASWLLLSEHCTQIVSK